MTDGWAETPGFYFSRTTGRDNARPELSTTARAALGSASVEEDERNEGYSCLVLATRKQSATLRDSKTEAV